MPQMAPSMWTLIYMSTITSVVIIMIMIYFWKETQIKFTSKNEIKLNKINWKW